MRIELLFYILLLGFGLAASHEDWRKRKIKNNWILWGLGACAAGYLFLLLNSLLGHWKLRFLGLGTYYLPFSFYPRVVLHLALAVTSGFFLWWMRIWPAGDAKLYIVFAASIPLIDQNILGFPLYLFLKILINIFVPAGLWVLGTMLISAAANLPKIRRPRFAAAKKKFIAIASRVTLYALDFWPYRYRLALYFINGLGLFTGIEIMSRRVSALEFFRHGLGPLCLLGMLYFVWGPLSATLRKLGTTVVCCVIASWMYLDPKIQEIGVWEILSDAVMTMFSFVIFVAAVKWIIFIILRKASEIRVEMKDLRPGMILSAKAWRAVGKLGEDREDEIPTRYADGLVPEDVAKLQSWPSAQDVALIIYQATPFALWVYIGTLLTLTLSKNVVHGVLRLFSDTSGTLETIIRALGN